MTLTSFTYIIFLIICVAAFYFMPSRLRPTWLLLCSAGFYLYTMPKAFFIMLLYAWAIYGIGCLKNKNRRKRKKILLSGIVISVLFLFVYKYLGFTISIFIGDNTFLLAAPMGIAYITLQGIAYLTELSNRRTPIVKNPVMFFLYLLFFPKLTAGPVESPQHFFSELKEQRAFSWQRSLEAVGLICTGLAKKLVVADLLAPGVAAVFDQGAAASNGLAAVLAAIMYSFQILFDFSGYTDIARGSALLFGIDLTENFKAPYLADSVAGFWRRWHISLSNWLKNYIYIPLGGSRRGNVRKGINVLITFLVSGIWHGAAFTFIFWGLLHGLYQVLEMLLAPALVRFRALLHIDEEGRLKKIFGIIRTFVLVTFAWIFFRAESMGAAFKVIGSFFAPWKGIADAFAIVKLSIPMLILIVVTALFTCFYKKKTTEVKRHIPYLVVAGCVIMLWLVFTAMLFAPAGGAVNTFIYFNF